MPWTYRLNGDDPIDGYTIEEETRREMLGGSLPASIRQVALVELEEDAKLICEAVNARRAP